MSNAEKIEQGKSPDAMNLDVALELLLKVAGDDMKLVNSAIMNRMTSSVPLIPQLAGHLITAGGKRLRPLLTLASARLCGLEDATVPANLAACIEFIHTATLLHDDVVDESELRRGSKSANAVWGNKASVLVGDFLFARSFELMVEAQSLQILQILCHAVSVIAEGEVLQLMTANDTATTEEQYLEVIKGKTAQLFAAACEVGAVVANRPAAEQQALADYGMNLGIAFQLIDDYLDYSAKQQELGKTVGDDFMDGKMTLPVILAYEQGTDEEKAFLRRCLEDQDMDDPQADLARAIEMMSRYDTLSQTVSRARQFGVKARESLMIFPPSEPREALVGIIDFCIDRAY